MISCQKEFEDIDLTQVIIQDGSLSGSEEMPEQNLVIRKNKDWNDLLEKVNAINNESDNFTETDIDFSQFMIIACFDAVRGSGGYDIHIADITQSSKKITVDVEQGSPGGGVVTTVITQSYLIIKLPTSKKTVSFK
jgi:hypothetical protein